MDEFVNGKWQGEDGNQTPFVGRADGSDVKIEFDPLATQPGYEKNVSYAAPSHGRKPSIAMIKRIGSNLQWRLVRGPGIDGIPENLVLRRERLNDRADSSERRDPTSTCSGLAGEQPLFEVAWASRSSATLDGFVFRDSD